jgi:uncharacterized membrane protein YidH (DUF202 family)
MDSGPQQLGKMLLLFAAVIAAVAALLMLAGRWKLPGDFQWESRNVKIYFPLATCIIISLVLTLILTVISWLRK